MPIQVINNGIPGVTTAKMLARFQFMVIAHNPKYVIIMGGTNDLALNLPDAYILSNMLAMTRLAKHQQITAVIGIPPHFFWDEIVTESTVFISSKSFKKRLQLFQNNLKQFAQEDDLFVIDFSLNAFPEHFLEDGLHPNKTGHEIMKNAAKTILSKLLF